MKSVQILFVILISTLVFSSCVTTRSELNEKRGQQHEEPTVVEEPIVNQPAGTSQYGAEEMRAELARLNGKVEELEQDKKVQKINQEEESGKLQVKIESLEKQLKEKEEENNKPSIPAGKTGFQVAKEAYYSSKYEVAITYLDQWLQENEKGKDVEEGLFLRGESYFKLKQYKKAIVDYSKFPEKFPKSNYSSKALFKIALSFEELGMKEDSTAFYQELSEKFPKTVEGKLAKKKLNGKSLKK